MDWFDLDELLRKSSLPEAARRLGLDLKPNGPTFLALCPFHTDSRPSLQLYPDDAAGHHPHFHCFACNAHGNAIDLVKQIQGVGFEPAVQWLAENFGVQPQRRGRVATGRAPARDRVLQARAFVEKVYAAAHEGEAFDEWAKGRGYLPDFLIGIGLRMVSGNPLVQALQLLPLDEQLPLADELETLGFIVRLRPPRKDEGTSFFLQLEEQFRDFSTARRVVIPIRSSDGRIEGYAGRSAGEMQNETAPKYLLTRGLKKSKHLFNADHALRALREEGKTDLAEHTLYIVEGFFDAIRLRSLGIAAVALMGTSLSSEQLNTLESFAEEAIPKSHVLKLRLFLDRDAAGARASARTVRQLLNLHGVALQWIACSDEAAKLSGIRPGKDPDDCLNLPATSQILGREALDRLADSAIGAIVLEELGSVNPEDLTDAHWTRLSPYHRDRALFNTVRAIRRFSKSGGPWHERLLASANAQSLWLSALIAVLPESSVERGIAVTTLPESLFLNDPVARRNHARLLAYHGSRRGELPCDEPNWVYLEVGASVFDHMLVDRLRSASRHLPMAAPFEAVHLPRKFSTDLKNLADPRRKVMPHPLDLVLQQFLMNELLTERHDFVVGQGEAFSDLIPAVRYYRSERRTRVTGSGLSSEALGTDGAEPVLSFAYQVDMDVLEGQRTPSDQGMFRPFGECWRDFMASLGRQTRSIGGKVHVARLDAKRYYDNISQYVVRDRLLAPIRSARELVGAEFFTDLLGPEREEPLENRLVDRICQCLFEHRYRDPDSGELKISARDIGIPQGPVLSAWIGTVVMFPVDAVARDLIRRTVRLDIDGREVPRLGYARYVDDIVLLADSEEMLATLRQAVQVAASKLELALVSKGDAVAPGSPEAVMEYLNEGRNFAASAPAWEPPLTGDDEWGWSLGDDGPELNRQSALRLLRHPGLLDHPETVHEKVREAMLAPDLRPGDLGKCTRLLWWQLAMTLPRPEPVSADEAWSLYWAAWSQVTAGHAWAADFGRVGYSVLAAIEGLDRLFDSDPWLEQGRTGVQAKQQRASIKCLASLVCNENFFMNAHAERNRAHLRRRQDLVIWKAHRHIEPNVVFIDRQIQGTRDRITLEQWFCFAIARLMNIPTPNDLGAPLDPKSALRPLVGRDLLEGQDGTHIAVAVRDRLLEPLAVEATSLNVEQRSSSVEVAASARRRKVADIVARELIIAATPRPRLWEMLSLYPLLLGKEESGLQVLPPLPGIESGHLIAALVNDSEPGVRLRAFWVERSDSSVQSPPSKFWGGPLGSDFGGTSLPQEWEEPPMLLEGGLQRWEARSPLPLSLAMRSGSLAADLHRTRFASDVFRALYAAQRRLCAELPDHEVVPVVPHLAKRGDGLTAEWFVLGEPIPSSTLGATGWVRGSGASLRSVAVPKAYGNLWRIGVAISDALGLANDIGAEDNSVEGDDQQPDRDGVEEYVLRQQLRKLRGQWISEANVRSDGVDGLPRSLERALEILADFPSGAPADEQVLALLKTEAETRAMAMRLADRGQDGLRGRLHQLPMAVLGRIPLRVLESLPIKVPNSEGGMRADLSVIYAIANGLADRIALSPGRVDASAALACALHLSVAAVGLHGLAASLQGLIREPMPESLILPADWPEADISRVDAEAAYAQIRDWINDDAWSQLVEATPWQWLLAVLGLLDKHLVRNDFRPAANSLMRVYGQLLTWEQAEPYELAAAVGWAWPFDDLPAITGELLGALSTLGRELPKAIASVEQSLGLVVQQSAGSSYGRNRHDNRFKDARGRSWRLRKAQFTELGQLRREGIASIDRNQERLVTWTEVRNRRGDDELLSVHAVDNKLVLWLTMPPSVVLPPERGMKAAEEAMVRSVPPVDTGLAANLDALLPTTNAASSSSSNDAGGATNDYAQSRGSRQPGCMRVAIFQWRVDESYSHPLVEAGINGLGLNPWHKAEICKYLIADSEIDVASRACHRGGEHLWGNRTEQVLSWPEHRRRRLLMAALEQCKRLEVDLLVLPEYSVRPETIDWLAAQLVHSPGLAVLAGTYRQLDPRDKENHFTSPLTLLWQPPRDVAMNLLGTENPSAIRWQRGKKYRAVAVNELFKPGWDELAPLFSPHQLLESFGLKNTSIDGKRAEALVRLMAEQLPPMRYCMELICSELFMLTSPANLLPLGREVSELLKRFPAAPGDQASEIVMRDFRVLAELLDIGHAHHNPRRSVLLVPAATSRTNDYWYAGQASVLASATATVFCNAVLGDEFKGGSCFIGADSTALLKVVPGLIDRLTPYHGWSKGIYLGRAGDALSASDQALVVADLDPVHVVGGKPRPQFLPHPLRLVAYLPIVEQLDAVANAKAVSAELIRAQGTVPTLPEALLVSVQSASKGKLSSPADFREKLQKLVDAVRAGVPIKGNDIEEFSKTFSDPAALRDRLNCWQRDRSQQPQAGQFRGKPSPAFLDFIEVDLTLQNGQDLCSIWVPEWHPDTPK